ncbi:MAG: hypothetical protein K0U41_08805 [Gammaproteobacteria bacterium]|nr:hypothetical protein [Gammaproteobacteria bacterium]
MAKYRKYDWPALIAKFEESGQTQTVFCQEHDLNPKYFSQRLKRCMQERNGLAKVEVTLPLANGIVIEYGQCRIHCAPQMTTPDIVHLVQALA